MPRVRLNVQVPGVKLSRGGACDIFCAGGFGRASAQTRSLPNGAAPIRMGILQGLLDKIGMGHVLAPRESVRVFLLDDDVLRHEWFAKQFAGDSVDVAENPARAIELLSSNYYDLIFLDHDLLPEHYYAEERDDERSGYAVARWLSERPDRCASAHIIAHTRNADGALRMVELLRRVGRPAEHVPFHMLAPRIKKLRKARG